MAKERVINTKFWDDSYITTLDPIEKLLYLYFITNPLTNIAGIYEISLRRMAFDTGIDKDTVTKILDRFEASEKIFYNGKWILVKNFIKNQSTESFKVQQGIKNEYERLPEEVRLWVNDIVDSFQSIDLPGKFSLTRRQIILTRDSCRCVYCQKEIFLDEEFEIDHCIPLSRGGKDNYENMVLACKDCNQSKQNMTPLEFNGSDAKGKKYHAEMAIKKLREEILLRNKIFEIYPTLKEKYSIIYLDLNLNSNSNSNSNLIGTQAKNLLDYFFNKFFEKYNEKMVVTGAKEIGLFKKLLETRTEDDLKLLIDSFFEFKDPWVIKAGYTVGVFSSVINKLLIQTKPMGIALDEFDPARERAQRLLEGK